MDFHKSERVSLHDSYKFKKDNEFLQCGTVMRCQHAPHAVTTLFYDLLDPENGTKPIQGSHLSWKTLGVTAWSSTSGSPPPSPQNTSPTQRTSNHGLESIRTFYPHNA